MLRRALLARTAVVLPTALLGACGSHAVAGPHVMGRADVEAAVRGLRDEVLRVDRIAAKRMTASELRRAQDAIALAARPAALLVWVVAVAGELRPGGRTATPPPRWAVYVFDSNTGETVGSQMGDGRGAWPPYFDRLPDH